jgi:hypothetical protein
MKTQKSELVKVSKLVDTCDNIYADVPVQEVKATGMKWSELIKLCDN